jgi:iron complex outermembrane receptor protein
LSVPDLLRNERIYVYYGLLTEEVFAIKNNVTVITASAKFPIVKLTYSRSFGGGIKERKQAAAQKEKDRIRE